jgi:hypothetical protein
MARRPLAPRPELLEQVLEGLRQGQTMKAACAATNLPDPHSVRRWCREDEEIADQVLEARREGIWAIHDTALEQLEKCSPQDSIRVREALAHSRWLMSKLLPEVFGDKSKLEHSGAVQHQVMVIRWAEEGERTMFDPMRDTDRSSLLLKDS